MKKALIPVVLLVTLVQYSFAQNTQKYKTWNPAKDTLKVLEGQGWAKGLEGYYDRLPARAEKTVRKPVWNLSKNTAGINLRFRTNAGEIIVKYAVSGHIQMAHMPATGVSGVDLYAKDVNGKWLWSGGKFAFGDTVTYRFSKIKPQGNKDREYTLYFPLYNSVKWMEISVPQESSFTPLPKRKEKPIVVYGTSIAQGGCASRPGLAWTSLLSRKLDEPVINLAFSGNGRLEKEVLDLVAEVDAKLYVLDCLPNLTYGRITMDALKKRIDSSVYHLQAARPGVPILLTEHDGYTDGEINSEKKKTYEDVNIALREAYHGLQAKGVKNIYLLSKNEIGQDIETTVDGTHSNDIGMMRYADAYEKTIRKIFNLPTGNISTTIPVTQYRELPAYDWEKRHNEVLIRNHTNPPQWVFIGNSITHYWAGAPAAHIARGTESWNKYFGPKNPVNLGFGWDRIENVLWRVHHGELDGIAAQQIVLMIGTNNLQFNTDAEIAEGMRFLIQAIQVKQPRSKILVLGLLPRKTMEARVQKVNLLYSQVAKELKVSYADAGKLFLNKDNKIIESLFTDGLHPNAEGYRKLGEFIISQTSR